MLHTYWSSVCEVLSAQQKSSMQAVESSNDQDHAEGNVEHRSIDAFEEVIGNDSNVIV
jgi:hypothetical protein